MVEQESGPISVLNQKLFLRNFCLRLFSKFFLKNEKKIFEGIFFKVFRVFKIFSNSFSNCDPRARASNGVET